LPYLGSYAIELLLATTNNQKDLDGQAASWEWLAKHNVLIEDWQKWLNMPQGWLAQSQPCHSLSGHVERRDTDWFSTQRGPAANDP
jgi:hypothetical protein